MSYSRSDSCCCLRCKILCCNGTDKMCIRDRHKNFGSHEIFHLFVMGGIICHFIVMYTFPVSYTHLDLYKRQVLVCIGALSKDMAEAANETVFATEKNMKVFHFDTKEDFYQNMGQILNENDTILVKASH